MQTTTTDATRKRAQDALARARELIKDPSRWAKGYYAFDAQDRCAADSPKALRWCTTGAVRRSLVGDHNDAVLVENEATRALQIVTVSRGGNPSVPDYNDQSSTTHADILSLFNDAIGQLSQEIAGNR